MSHEYQHPPGVALTDFVLNHPNGINNFSKLWAPNLQNAENVFSQQLTETLLGTSFPPSLDSGQLLQVYQPESEGMKHPVVVKVLGKTAKEYCDYFIRGIQLVKSQDIQNVLNVPGLLYLGSDLINVTQEQSAEETLACLAVLHKWYEETYPDFVLPGVFTTFTLSSDLNGKHILNKDDLKKLENVRNVGLISADNRLIMVHAGTKVTAHVMPFVDIKTSAYPDNPLLTAEEIQQLIKFYEQTQMSLHSKRMIPDKKTFSKNSDLVVSQTGKLVLLDTNFWNYMPPGDDFDNMISDWDAFFNKKISELDRKTRS